MTVHRADTDGPRVLSANAAAGVEFCLLGPLLVRRGSEVIPLPSGKQRVVLATLLLAGSAVVSHDGLIEALWGARPPASARAALQNHLSRLRQALSRLGIDRVSTEPGGYAISVDPGELDAARFESLVREARQASGEHDWDTAANQLRGALSLWRGEALADVPSESLAAREVPRLTELRMTALEARIDADLHLGRHAELIGELRQLTSVHPLRERLHAMLMLALYRNGQQADALAAYQRARTTLIEELGAEPGPELRQFEQRILTADPELSAAPDWQPSKVPRQLPAPVWHFAGRQRELAALTTMLTNAAGARSAGRVAIATIDGPPGIGKTALAVHWAHQVADRFPDGQLYVDLRGFAPAGTPTKPAEAIRGFLDALAMPDASIPASLDAQSALYRSLLAGKHMLIVLDNARDEDQVRPLLPGSPGCVVLVTSRRQLGGLIAESAARRICLDLLSEAEALDLLTSRLGRGRVTGEHAAAAAELTSLCARLPLALAVAAARASMRDAFPLAVLTAELRDTAGRLAALEVRDASMSVPAAFSWSYEHLSATAARLFRLLGLHPGRDITIGTAGSLAGLGLPATRTALLELTDINLCAEHAPGRFTFHDLLRAFAAQQAGAHEPARSQRAALTGLFDYYLAAAAAAADIVAPAERSRRPRIPHPAAPLPPMDDPATAQAWLDAERANLVAASAMTAQGWPDHAIRLASILFRYLDSGSHNSEAIAIHSHALAAARTIGDVTAHADSLRCLGAVAWRESRYQQAARHFREALGLYRSAGNQIGEGRCLDGLSLAVAKQGKYSEACALHEQAHAIFRELEDPLGEARSLDNHGVLLTRLGCYEEAEAQHRAALAVFRELDDQLAQAGALDNLAAVLARTGRQDDAREHHEQALARFRELGHRPGEAGALENLGLLLGRQGCHEQAAACHREALRLFREVGDKSGEAAGLNNVGVCLTTTGQLALARTAHEDALTLARQIDDPYQQAHAHNALARLCHLDGDEVGAGRHWNLALVIFTDLGVPEAEEVEASLRSDAT
jgi:DNA-binding SARP family transcriptional activator/Tfp pilus assembly protein PilF